MHGQKNIKLCDSKKKLFCTSCARKRGIINNFEHNLLYVGYIEHGHTNISVYNKVNTCYSVYVFIRAVVDNGIQKILITFRESNSFSNTVFVGSKHSAP